MSPRTWEGGGADHPAASAPETTIHPGPQSDAGCDSHDIAAGLDVETISEVHRLVADVVRVVHGRGEQVPGVGTPRWREAPVDARIAGLLVLAQAYLVTDPGRVAAEQLKAAAAAVSGALGTVGPSHAEIARRRAQPGPQARAVDPSAARAWVGTGEGAAA